MKTTLPQFVIIDGKRTPGKAVVTGGTEPRGYQEQPAKGSTGASLKWTGDGLVEFTITIEIWDPADEAAYDADIVPIVKRTAPGVKPKAYLIEHPQINDLDVSKVVVIDRGQTDVDEEGKSTRWFKVKQYRPPAPAITGKPTASGGDPSNPNPTAKDEADRMIQSLEKQRDQAAKDLAEAEAKYK